MKTTTQDRCGVLTAAVVSLMLVCSGTSFSQNLGDAARQERERKQNLAQHSAHVYTNDDLKKAQILVPEDRERVLAARKNLNSPAGQPAQVDAAAPAEPGVAAPNVAAEIVAIARATEAARRASEMAAHDRSPKQVSRPVPKVSAAQVVPPHAFLSAAIVEKSKHVPPPAVAPVAPAAPVASVSPDSGAAKVAKVEKFEKVEKAEKKAHVATVAPVAPVTHAAVVAKTDTSKHASVVVPVAPVAKSAVNTPVVTKVETKTEAAIVAPVTPAAKSSVVAKVETSKHVSPAAPVTPVVHTAVVAKVEKKDHVSHVATVVPMAPVSKAAPVVTVAPVVAVATMRPAVTAADHSVVAKVQPAKPLPAAVPAAPVAPTHAIVTPAAEKKQHTVAVVPVTPVAKTAVVAKAATVAKPEKADHIASVASVTPVAEKQVVPVADRTPVVAPLAAKEDAGLEMSDRVLIQKGDSLWKLAAEHLGDGTRWPELARLNPEIADPNLVRIGEWVRVREEKGDTSKHVVVQPGDTLSKVAQAEFGNARALTCIEQANPAVHSVDRIYPGEKLILPPTCDVTR